MPDLVEIAADIGNGAEIACLAAGEKEQLVEKLEGCCRGLVDTGNDEDLAWTLLEDILGMHLQNPTHIVRPRQLLRIRHDLVASC